MKLNSLSHLKLTYVKTIKVDKALGWAPCLSQQTNIDQKRKEKWNISVKIKNNN